MNDELMTQEDALPVPIAIIRDTRPVKSLDQWAKIVEKELVIVQGDDGEHRLMYFEAALRATLHQKRDLQQEL